MDLKHDLAELDQMGRLSGRLENLGFGGKPVLVVVLKADVSKPIAERIVVHEVLYAPGPFTFLAPPGDYVVAAFEDANENMAYENTEYIGAVGHPAPLTLKPGLHLDNLSITLLPPEKALALAPRLKDIPSTPLPKDVGRIRLGEVVDPADARFSHENAELGLWKPLTFLETVGAGLYQLDPDSPGKIPVLFIHGAAGSPRDFAAMLTALDRTRFQAWLAHYPSGLRLENIVQGLDRAVAVQRERTKTRDLFIVAHSMGGLVGRGLVNEMEARGSGRSVKLFVSISAPFGGHELAALGIKRAPAVIPSWYDMASGSPYLKSLFAKPTPKSIENHLLFTYRGEKSALSGQWTDGAVSLQSQLLLLAQEAAVQLRGFDESHVGVLSSPIVVEYLNQVLHNRADSLAQGGTGKRR